MAEVRAIADRRTHAAIITMRERGELALDKGEAEHLLDRESNRLTLDKLGIKYAHADRRTHIAIVAMRERGGAGG